MDIPPPPVQITPSPEFEAALLREHQIALGTVFLTAEEAAKRLGLSTRHLRALTGAWLVPGIKDGNKYRYHWPSVVVGMGKKLKA